MQIQVGVGLQHILHGKVVDPIRDSRIAYIEDQVAQKRCGHRPNKEIVPTGEMIDRIKATDAKTDDDLL